MKPITSNFSCGVPVFNPEKMCTCRANIHKNNWNGKIDQLLVAKLKVSSIFIIRFEILTEQNLSSNSL